MKTTDVQYHYVPGVDIQWSLAPQYPACQSIDLVDYFDFNVYVPSIIQFLLGTNENMGVTLLIEDRELRTKRRIIKNDLVYNGPILKLTDVSKGWELWAGMKITQNINTPKDKAAKCKIYPNLHYKTYMQCDEKFVFNEMKDIYNFVPFWTTDNFTIVTTQR